MQPAWALLNDLTASGAALLQHRIKRARHLQVTAVRHDANGDSHLLWRTGLGQICRGTGMDQR
jgi:hypothetical protein